MNPILYVLINKELKMSPGKAAAQAVHAAMSLKDDVFADSYKRTVVVLEAKDTKQIENLWEYLDNAGIHAEYYIDEGANEVDAYSITAMAVEPIEAGDTEKREIFEPFKLYTYESDEVVKALTEYAQAATSTLENKMIAKRSVEHEALYRLQEFRDKKFVRHINNGSRYRPDTIRVDASPRWLRKAIKKLGEMQ